MCPCTIHPLLGEGEGRTKRLILPYLHKNQFQTDLVQLGSGWLWLWLRLWCDSLGRGFRGHRPAVIDAVHTSDWDGLSEVWVSLGGPHSGRPGKFERSEQLADPSCCMRFWVWTHRPGTHSPRRDVSSARGIVQSMEHPRLSVRGHIGRGHIGQRTHRHGIGRTAQNKMDGYTRSDFP